MFALLFTALHICTISSKTGGGDTWQIFLVSVPEETFPDNINLFEGNVIEEKQMFQIKLLLRFSNQLCWL